ncbi:A24 family peptidase [Actinocorallia libanotica]|uniref:Prepilin type IV endopeptidase peptidase domain-containing protein n=1 Tax=Actinocorallia libanotica TaxID=46162 RepID=A0ABN1RUN1_9ACTN
MLVVLCTGVGAAGLAAGWFLAPTAERYVGRLTARRRAAIAATAGGVSAALAARFGFAPVLVPYLYLGVVCALLTFIDLAVQRLPDPYTLPSYLVGPLLLAAAAPFTELGWPRLVFGLIGLAALWLVYGVQHFLLPDAIGRGDVKLAGVLGLYLGWLGLDAWIWGMTGGMLAGGLWGAALLLRGRRRTHFPYGPFMIAGALAAVLLV